MKCEICNKDIFYELSFKDLFSFKFICRECEKKLKEKETLIPIDYGYFIHHIYYLINDKVSDEIEEYLNEKVIDFTLKNKRKFIILYDENDAYFYPFLNFKEDIFIVNFEYVELENLYEE